MAGATSGPSAARDTTPNSQHPFRYGWIVFAAVLMIFGGLMAIFEGIAAIAKGNVFVVTPDYFFRFSLTGWGWIHLILGIVIVLAGCGLFTGAAWARVVGIVVAGLVALAHFLWLPFYPFWSLVIIAINIFVIWALCTSPMEDEKVSAGQSRSARV